MINLTLFDGTTAVLKEAYDGFEKGIDLAAGPWVEKTYLCEDWTKTDAACNALMGRAAASTIGGSITRVFPHICPDSTDLICLDARGAGQGEIDARDGGRPRFNQCLIRTRYGIPQHYDTLPTDDPGGLNSFPNDDNPGSPFTYAIQSIDFDTEVIKLPGTAYKFSTTPTLAVDVPVSVTVAVATMVFIRKQVPYLATNNIVGKMNRLNDRTMFGQPMGQIKFLRARTRRELVSDGTRTQEVEMHFKWREFDHNKFHRPDQRSFDFIVDSTGAKPYIYTDLRPLFQ